MKESERICFFGADAVYGRQGARHREKEGVVAPLTRFVGSNQILLKKPI
jgi:hypothetical protein